MHKLDEVRARLVERRDFLAARLAAIKQEVVREEDPLSADWSEQAAQRENDEVLDGLGRASQDELSLVGRAIQRIDDGTYLECSVCAEPIAEARLAALPFVRTCIRCAEQADI